MDDESIIALYWRRDQRAITETDTKYGALSEERSYVPSGSGAIPGINAAVISAAVTQTEVETYLEIRCTRGAAVTEALDSEGLSFRIYAAGGTELPSSSGSGALEPDENGEYVTGYVLYKCDPGESFTPSTAGKRTSTAV